MGSQLMTSAKSQKVKNDSGENNSPKLCINQGYLNVYDRGIPYTFTMESFPNLA